MEKVARDYDKFRENVPKILQTQLVTSLANQFLEGDKERKGDDDEFVEYCVPSIYRYYAALLFIDISGFTVLSQRLPVDELRTHINGYFKRIIDIVDLHGGDVVKFAGDALFVVWPIEHRNGDIDHLNMAKAATSAVTCGTEIMRTCSHYRIDFKEKDTVYENIASLVLSPLGHHDHNLASPSNSLPPSVEILQDNFTYLDVHAGASCGLFYGMDVGANDRWEYLIAGDPLQEVALAESEAEKGELVVTSSVHEYVCGQSSLSECYLGDDCLPCGCQCTPSGVFKVKKPSISPRTPRISRFTKKLAKIVHRTAATNHYEDFYGFGRDIFHAIKDKASLKLAKYRLAEMSMESVSIKGAKSLKRSPSKYFLKQNQQMRYLEDIEHSDEEVMSTFFLDWLTSSITDDFVRHTHEADRSEYVMQNISRSSCIERIHDGETVDDNIVSWTDECPVSFLNNDPFPMSPALLTPGAKSVTTQSPFTFSGLDLIDGESNSTRKSIRRASEYNFTERQKRLMKNEELTSGELRKVIVMFINLKIPSTSAVEGDEYTEGDDDDTNDDDFVETEGLSSSVFLPRTRKQLDADMVMLGKYQTCIATILGALNEVGGQLRQFIVDDKGTVCIGTFGLRGSMNVDNAATAIETAKVIIKNLRLMHIGAAIGLTIGRAYCGPVGSPSRHEYACMGPSTNLSARLMGKARIGEIICDANFRRADSAHRFVRLGWIKAKGYTQPVPTYTPIFDESITAAMAHDSVEDNEQRFLQLSKSNDGQPEENDADESESFQELYGREEEMKKMFDFIFGPLSQNQAHYDIIYQVLYEGQKMHNRDVTAQTLKMDEATRMIVLEGHNGIGKSKLIKLLSQKAISYWARKLINVQLVYAKCLSFNRTIPFKSWKRLVRSLCLHVTKSVSLPVEFNRSIASMTPRDQLFAKTRFGAEHLVSNMDARSIELLPLLSSGEVISGFSENQTTQNFTTENKLWRLGKLLRDMILFFPKFSKKIAMLSFDDVQYMDSYSWKLLTEIWGRGKGIVLLLSVASTSEIKIMDLLQHEQLNSPMSSSSGGGGGGHPRCSVSFESMERETSRFLKIQLGTLPFSVVKSIASKVFTICGVSPGNVDDTVFVQLEEHSGGKPLYIIELTKAVATKFKTLTVIPDAPTITSMSHHSFSAHIQDSFVSSHTTSSDGLAVTSNASHTFYDASHVKEVFQKFNSHRVDEVIYERFDKLDYQGQILLKIGAVASIFGLHHGFTLDLLVYVLHTSVDEEVSDSIIMSRPAMSRKVSSSDMSSGRISPTSESCLEQFDSFMLDSSLPQQISLALYKIIMHDEFLKIQMVPDHLDDHNNDETDDGRRSNTPDSDIYSDSDRDSFSNNISPFKPSKMLRRISAFNNRNSLRAETATVGYNAATFDFRVAIEVNAVYQLLLEDQRVLFHHKIAAYLAQKNEEYYRQSPLSRARMMSTRNLCGRSLDFKQAAEAITEEGMHWEHAMYWGRAMQCYDRAAQILDTHGDYAESSARLASAYRMLTKMQKASGIEEGRVSDIFRRVDMTFDRLWQQTKMEFGVGACSNESMSFISTVNEAAEEEDFWRKRKLLFDVFNGNKSLLSIGFDVMIRFAQNTHHLEEQWEVANVLYEDVLHMLLYVKPYKAFGIKPPSPPKNSNYDPKLAEFILDDPNVFFAILLGLSLLYRTKRLADDINHKSECALYRTVLLLASTDEKRFVVHRLKCLGLLASFQRESLQYEKSIVTIEEMRRLYDYDEHFEESLRIYANDTNPFSLAKAAQYEVLLGYFQNSQVLVRKLMAIMPRVTHMATLGQCALLVGTVFIMQHLPAEALTSFQIYLSLDSSMASSFSLFRPVNNLYLRWFTVKQELLLMHKGDDFAPKYTALDDLEQQILDRTFLSSDSTQVDKRGCRFQSGVLHERVAIYGMGIEFPCCEILLCRATIWIESLLQTPGALSEEALDILDHAKELLMCALDYAAITADAFVQNSLFFVPYVKALRSQADIFVQLMRIEEACRKKSSSHVADSDEGCELHVEEERNWDGYQSSKLFTLQPIASMHHLTIAVDPMISRPHSMSVAALLDPDDSYRTQLIDTLDALVALATQHRFHFLLLVAGDYYVEYKLRVDYGWKLLEKSMEAILMLSDTSYGEAAFVYLEKKVRHVHVLKKKLLQRVKVRKAEEAVGAF